MRYADAITQDLAAAQQAIADADAEVRSREPGLRDLREQLVAAEAAIAPYRRASREAKERAYQLSKDLAIAVKFGRLETPPPESG